tara:strand:+ start:3217 stop:3405 length:189 start_codon:yes stop_codon:yes gene_type:complete
MGFLPWNDVQKHHLAGALLLVAGLTMTIPQLAGFLSIGAGPVTVQLVLGVLSVVVGLDIFVK